MQPFSRWNLLKVLGCRRVGRAGMQVSRRVGHWIDRSEQKARRAWVLRSLGERGADLRRDEEWEGFKN